MTSVSVSTRCYQSVNCWSSVSGCGRAQQLRAGTHAIRHNQQPTSIIFGKTTLPKYLRRAILTHFKVYLAFGMRAPPYRVGAEKTRFRFGSVDHLTTRGTIPVKSARGMLLYEYLPRRMVIFSESAPGIGPSVIHISGVYIYVDRQSARRTAVLVKYYSILFSGAIY